MKRRIFIFLWLVNSIIGQEVEPIIIDPTANHAKILDKRENYFRTSTDFQIAPKVHPITGEYCEEEVDLVVAGSELISARRFYNSFSPHDPRHGYWRYNPETFLVANLEWQGQEIFAAVGDYDGSVCTLTPSSHQNFHFQPSNGFTILSSDGKSHPLNTSFHFDHFKDPKDKHRYQYTGTIIDGSGRKRSFVSSMHRWTHYVHWREKRGNWLAGGECLWLIFANTWTPYQIPIMEERLPNGNLICYTYTKWKEEKKNFPLPRLLESITAYNSNKTILLGSIRFRYIKNKYDEIERIDITGSDGRVAQLKQERVNKSLIRLTSAERAGQPRVKYNHGYQDKIATIDKPYGRSILTHYNQDGKVICQEAAIGMNGERTLLHRYEYHDKLTVVSDGQNNKTYYHYDDNKKITTIEKYGEFLCRRDRFEWDRTTGNLLKKTIEDSSHPVQIFEYEYDKNQNPICEKMGDGKEWRTIRRTYSEDGFNLKLSETDREGTCIRYSYIPNTNLLASELFYENDRIKKRIFHFYDNCAVCIKTIIDDGQSEDFQDLKGITYRKITVISPKKNVPCFGLPESVEEKTIDSFGREISLGKIVYFYAPFGKITKEDHYDANGELHHSINNTYDQNELLTSTRDAAGNKTDFYYDENRNLTKIIGPKAGQCREIVYDCMDHPVVIFDLQNDGSKLTIRKNYDSNGRVFEEIDACGNSTRMQYDPLGRIIAVHHPDGAIERKEYDVLGNIIKEIDPQGFETIKTYNAFGQVLSIHYPDGSKEEYSYNSTGTLHTKLDKNGTTTVYSYDIFDHPIQISYFFGKQFLYSKKATYTPFAVLSETDGEGHTIFYSYDFCGRKISEKIDNKNISFTYNTVGLLAATNYECFEENNSYDKLGRLITKSVIADTLQFQESYGYDAASHQTHRITAYGIFESIYNSLGKLLSETNPLGFSTKYTYSFKKQYSHTETDANQITTTFFYDNRGRIIEICKSNPKGQLIAKSEHQYDLNGNQIALTHYIFNGSELLKTITHQWKYGPLNRLESFIEAGEKETKSLYDTKGRLKCIVKPSGIILNYEYDSFGRIVDYFSEDFHYHYTYDNNNQLLSVVDTYTKTTRKYNALGNLIEENLANGLIMKNSYDQQGRRNSLFLPDNSTIEYTYQGAYLYKINRNGTKTSYTRDLNGNLIEISLPLDLGTMILTRDVLSRIKEQVSPFYCSFFTKDSYDPVGNLLSYTYQDPLGEIDCEFLYDSLNQLTAENEHSYIFDSLFNRLKKNGASHIVNDFCQILDDGKKEYSYDLDGNLLFDGTWHYTYDSQNRLISLENAKNRIEYTYDPFHRRMSKKIWINDQLQHNERYLWDGDNEIGVVEENTITQLRVLGEGLGAEIGAAVLFELNGKTYIPLHDFKGNVVVVIDVATNEPATYRYTAFGEESTEGFLVPWRFSSKRVEEESQLLFFGRRYYLPTLGRWITQDPQGFDDGPNLYAYLSNCPLIGIDPYGLQGIFHPLDFCGLVGYGIKKFCGIGRSQIYLDFEDRFWQKSDTYNLYDFGYNFPDPTVGAYCFGNGVGNQSLDWMEKARTISEISGFNTIGVYNATHTLKVDIHEAAMNLISHIITPPVKYYHKLWDSYFDHDTTGAPLLQICHSQGSPQLRNGLETYSEDRRKRIIVAAFAPFAYINPELCMKVTHYVCPFDMVPKFDFINKKKYKDTIIYVKKMKGCKENCHEFLNPIYLPFLEREINNYKDILRKYEN